MIEIFDFQQNSGEWYRIRSGLATASNFKLILAKGEGKTRKSYMNRLAAEIITGEPLENFTSPAMARGQALEDEARAYFSFLMGAQPTPVGFIRNGKVGCSPDSLLGNSGLLEIKTQRGDLLIETLLKDEFPSEHRAQVQGQLWVAEREICHLIVFWPGMPPFIKTVGRDEPYIADLAAAVERFNEELAEVVERIKSYGLREQEVAA